MPTVQGLTVQVQRFAFAGNTLIDAAQLQPLVAPYLNRPLAFTELQAAASAVAEYYRQAGWVVQTYLPAQDLSEGTVTIQVLETTLGALKFERSLAAPGLQAQVENIFRSQLPLGQALNAQPLERATLLANDLPGAGVEASLVPGANPMHTDVAVTSLDKPASYADLGTDNAGAESTGIYRLSAYGQFGNPGGYGDRLAWNALHSDGSDYVRLAYSLPLGGDGWRVGVNSARFDYKLNAADLAALHATGSSDVNGLEASYPLLRARQHNLQLNLAYDQRHYENRANAATTTRYRIDSLGLGLEGNTYESARGNAFSSAALTWVAGYLDLGGSPNQAADAATTQAAGSYNKLRYSLSRQQDIAPTLAWYAALTGQMADKNLDSSEKLYLGGADGVRAFPSSEAGGSEGQVLNLELRWRPDAAWGLTGFYDWGEIQVNRFNSFVGAATPNRYALQGGGLALSWQGVSGVRLALSWARRSQANPNPTAGGNDQDGTRHIDRIWASAHVFF
ncbi:MAG: ShlB/FhaC/HecB family hemolysin secretion/activation protein [Rhodoferax sp.]|nr:ShlB/FhaC/HecB family hemolysin secretion/activation protein [Rhodoferax sp.]